jgi:glucose-6-phosphate-specific signal transduction histidine kinase
MRWTLLALMVLAPAILLAAVMFRYGWLLVGSLVAVVIISALIHHQFDQPEDVGRRDLLLMLAFLALSVIGITFIVLTVMYAPQ